MMTNHIPFAQFCSAVRRKGALALCLALCTLGLGLCGSAKEFTIKTFDAPRAGNQVTDAEDVNPAGAITGWYVDARGVSHGFLRTPDGIVTTFEAPGAGTGANQGTFVSNINAAGAITGEYLDGRNVWHGFLRAPDGRFTTFDAPRAGNRLTDAENINPVGMVAGGYLDASNVARPDSGVGVSGKRDAASRLRHRQTASRTPSRRGKAGI